MNLVHQEGLLNQAQDLIGNKAVWTSDGNTFAHINNKYFKIETDEDIRNLTKIKDGIEDSVYTEDTDETVFPNQQERKFTASPTTKKNEGSRSTSPRSNNKHPRNEGNP